MSSTLKTYCPLRSPRTVVEEAPVATIDDKIGKVIREIKEINREKAQKYGINMNNVSKTR
jgi:hypothetical protein